MNSTETKPTSSSPDLFTKMDEAARIAMSNVRDPDVMRQACKQMDHLREENRKSFGIQNIAVELVREIRDQR
jgi:hypothetical protein